jgi:hypothetical protein
VTDVNGNVSTATAVVTVEDQIAPIVLTKNITVDLLGGRVIITPSQIDNGSTDNCGIASYTLSRTDFDCSSIGNQTVTLTVTDNNGNVSSKTAVVKVVGELTSSALASIPTSSTYTGGVSTNLYLGYGAQSTTLKVTNTVIGGNGTDPRSYTYEWTGAAIAQLSSTTSGSPIFTPTTAGYYTFNVKVTNKYGCISFATINICVKDIREVDKKGNFTGKVFFTHVPPGNSSNPQTIVISVNAIPAHLSNHSGDRLGASTDLPCTSGLVTSATNDTNSVVNSASEITLGTSTLVAYPNPFARQTTVSFSLPYQDDYTTLDIYDLRGVKIQTLFNGNANAKTTYEVQFNGEGIAAGSYIFRLSTSKEVKNFKVVMSTN